MNGGGRIEDGCNVIVSRCGGRQGCKLGSILFNMVYSKALRECRECMLAEGIVLLLPECVSGAFWSPEVQANSVPPTASSAPLLPVGEATYVDDEFLAIVDTKPKRLASNIPKLLNIVLRVFRKHGFDVNFKKGKTECFLKFRGPQSAKWYDKLFVSSSLPPLLCPQSSPRRTVRFFTLLMSTNMLELL